jgi:predicted dehydrogenase
MEITGTSGRITIPVPFKPGVSETIRIQDNESSRTIQINGEPLYAGEVADIENAILNGISPRIGLEESLEYVETIEGLYRSARTNKPIHI